MLRHPFAPMGTAIRWAVEQTAS